MQQIELDQVQTQLSQLLQQALAGEEVVIAQVNQPVLKLVRVAIAPPRRKRGSAKGQIRIAPDFDAPSDNFRAYVP